MKHALLKGALPIYANLLAETCGIEVEFGHAIPHADGNKIYLPDLPMDDPDAKALAFGLIMHEAGHLTETQFGVWPNEKVLQRLTNLLEDVRMEARQIAKYPGASQRLALMVEALVKSGYLSQPTAAHSPNELLSAFLLFRLRESVLSQKAVAEYADMAEELCREKLPGAVVTRLVMLMENVTSCRDTADVVALAKEILKMLHEEEENARNDPPQPPQNPGQDLEETGQALGSGSGDAGSSADDDSTGQPDNQGGASDEEDDQDASASSGSDDDKAQNLARILSGEDDKGLEDLGDVLSEAIGEIARESDNPIGMPKAQRRTGGYGEAEQMLARVANETRALRRRLANHLEALRQSRVQVGRRGRRLAANRLYRLETGDARVLARRIPGVEINTAVSVLIDRSISMRHRIDLAVDAGLALYAALDKVSGVSTSVAAFPHTVAGDSNGILALADHADNMRSRAQSFSGVGVGGGTPMAQAMMWAGYQLIRRPEQRKILFICTDGEPDSPESARQVIEMLSEDGIEIISLGINHDTSGLFPNSTMITTIAEMPSAVFEVMQTQLLKAA